MIFEISKVVKTCCSIAILSALGTLCPRFRLLDTLSNFPRLTYSYFHYSSFIFIILTWCSIAILSSLWHTLSKVETPFSYSSFIFIFIIHFDPVLGRAAQLLFSPLFGTRCRTLFVISHFHIHYLFHFHYSFWPASQLLFSPLYGTLCPRFRLLDTLPSNFPRLTLHLRYFTQAQFEDDLINTSLIAATLIEG